MSRYNHPHKLKNATIAAHIAGGIICVLLLCLMYPHEVTTKLDYRLGEPWDADVLIAKDSFDVYKSEEEQQRERDSLRTLYEPYYNLNTKVAAMVQKRFKQELDSLTRQEPGKRGMASKLLKDLAAHYDRGIVENEAHARLLDEGVSYIHKYDHPSDRRIALKDIHTVKTTLEDIMEHSASMRAVLQRSHLSQYLQPNLAYNASLSEKQKAEIDKFATTCSGRVMVGEKIVDRGQIVTQEVYDKLQSYERNAKERGRTSAETTGLIVGVALYILLVVIALYIFFYQFRSDYLHTRKYILLVYLLFLLFPILCYSLARNEFLSIYIVPYCMVPIFLRVFMDSRTAFITHLACIMLCSLATNHPFEFMVTQILAGLTAIYSLKQLQQRSELFVSVILVTAVSLMVNLCLDLLRANFLSSTGADGTVYVYICVNGILLFISYLLLFPIEKAFGFTSMVTLVELSNVNHPALRRLSEEAPGTFQHSMQVANLAAAVANALGAKSQLVRTGALYHDIGKLKNPVFFTENQSGKNPHDELPYEDSAQIIIQHVRYGLELASKYNLPPDIKELIATHHGRSKAKYFYISYTNAHPDREVNEEIFTYPGPNPTTKEHAILMMADTVEAASRSLQEYTEEAIAQLVDRIIDGQLQEGYFRQCDITFADIDRAKRIFKDKLKSIYHTRVVYPQMSKQNS